MENSKKKNLLTASAYIIVSFCFLVLIGIGVFASLRAAFTQPQEIEHELPKTNFDITDPKPATPQIPVIPDNNEVFEPELVPENPVSETAKEPIVVEKTKYVLPVSGDVSKEFSKDTLVFSQTMKDYRTHSGIDFICEYGQPVKCFSDGTIENFYDDPLNGMTMVVRHSDSLVSRYCNLSSELPEGIEVGSSVRAGDNIAFIGEPGILECSEGYHLHFEIEKDMQNVGLTNFEISE